MACFPSTLLLSFLLVIRYRRILVILLHRVAMRSASSYSLLVCSSAERQLDHRLRRQIHAGV